MNPNYCGNPVPNLLTPEHRGICPISENTAIRLINCRAIQSRMRISTLIQLSESHLTIFTAWSSAQSQSACSELTWDSLTWHWIPWWRLTFLPHLPPSISHPTATACCNYLNTSSSVFQDKPQKMAPHGRKLSMLETLFMNFKNLLILKIQRTFFWAGFHYGQTFLFLLFWQCLWYCKYLNIEHQYDDNWSQQHFTVSCRQRGRQTGARISLSSEQLRISFTLLS